MRRADAKERQENRAKPTAVELSLGEAKGRLEHEGTADVWIEISAADLRCLTSKRPPRVAEVYRKALVDAPEPPRVLVFIGHMIDAPGRAKPRFPPDKEEVARQEIRKAVEAEQRRPGGVAFGIAGGASGGDVLFHEICGELGIPTRLFLALPKGQFIQESVQPAGGDWIERFDRLTEKLPVRVLAHSKELPSWLAEKPDYGIWQRNNLWMLHNALAEGGENVTLIALWNGEEGDGPGGTGDLVERARARNARTVVLNTRTLFGT